MNNIILNTDSYKHSHYLQYPEGTEYVYSYIESRGGEYMSTLFFGLQAFIKEYLMKPVTLENVLEAEHFCKQHGVPFNKEGWMYIYSAHNGYLPVEIRAVPEGSIINVNNVLLTIVNTDPKCFWLTSFLETALLRAIWYPTTVATKAWSIKKTIKSYYMKTAILPLYEINHKLVDFGSRGVSSEESSALGGMGHLVSFDTTDNMSAILAAKRYYRDTMVGFSIPASEHSTMTSWGKENEAKAYENMVIKFGDGPAYSVVSDSYDIMNAVGEIWGVQLKELVQSKIRSRLIVRPDSGDPIETPIMVIEKLLESYGGIVNAKGYRILPDCVRVLQGDGIGEKDIETILSKLEQRKICVDNIVFGMGGGLLQNCTRDTQKFAMKCSAACVNGVWRDVYKEAPGKKSKRGLLALVDDGWNNGTYKTISHVENVENDMLRLVYRNGNLIIDEMFQEIRKRADAYNP